jgi:DNA-binding XRE family transcriptional regulator
VLRSASWKSSLATGFSSCYSRTPPLRGSLPFCHVRLSARKPESEAYPTALITYGDHLRVKRLGLGLLQKQAAEQIGVDETSVYNWESNRVEPAVRLIPGIIRFLGYCPYTPGLPTPERLKLVRQSLGYSQGRMAEALGIDEGTWRHWETGRRQLSTEYMSRIIDLIASPDPA